MNKIYFITVIIVLASVISACTEKEETFGSVFESTGTPLTFASNADTKSVMINTNQNFTVQSSQPWCLTEIVPEEINNLRVSVSESEVIGKQRKATITASSDGLDDILIDIIQDGIAPIINCSSASIVLEDGEATFSLTITTNILVDFILPDWIHLQENNAPGIGEKEYHFDIEAITEGEIRTENIIVKAEDSEINKSISIFIKQGKELTYNGPLVTNSEPTVVEAESSEEGLESKIQTWWRDSEIMWGGNYYINLYSTTATYHIRVADQGSYDFTFDVACWGGGDLELLIDNVEVGNANDVPATDGATVTHAVIENISLVTGDHVIKITSTGNFDFDLFTITAR